MRRRRGGQAKLEIKISIMLTLSCQTEEKEKRKYRRMETQLKHKETEGRLEKYTTWMMEQHPQTNLCKCIIHNNQACLGKQTQPH